MLAKLQVWDLEACDAWLRRAKGHILNEDFKAWQELVKALQGKDFVARAKKPLPLTQMVLACRRQDFMGAMALSRGGAGPKVTREMKLMALWDALVAWSTLRTAGPAPKVDVVKLLGEVGPERLQAFWPELWDACRELTTEVR